jgi:hypothetical protein
VVDTKKVRFEDAQPPPAVAAVDPNILRVPFVASDTFQGARPGYVFQRGAQGNGYYLDALLSPPLGQTQGHADDEESDDDDDVGPSLPSSSSSSANASASGFGTFTGGVAATHGGNLLAGEGAAIASYVQRNLRIPRRGEVGWTGGEIANLEAQGYVMSGSRHAKMNAVRLRKENQVYTSEEKRALVLLQAQQQAERSQQVTEEFKIMVEEELAKKKAEAKALAAAAAGET